MEQENRTRRVIDTVYCHFSFKRPKGKDYGLFAVAFYWDYDGKKLAAQATRKYPLWENHQFVTAVQAYEHALYSIYTWQGLMKSKGIRKVQLVTDNSTLAGWIQNPKKNRDYTEYMDRAVRQYRAGAPKEITLSVGLCEVWNYERSYKFCKEDKVINDEAPAIEKTVDSKRVINLDTLNMQYSTITEIERINSELRKPEIVGIKEEGEQPEEE